MTRWLQENPLWEGSFHALCLGKAACPMALALQNYFGSRLVQGLTLSHVLGASGALDARWLNIVGAHPRPDQQSLHAGHKLLEWIASLSSDDAVVACLSGGASSIVELPKEGYGLADLQECLDLSFVEGWTIERLNLERSKRSALKAGGIARLLGSRLKAVLCLSDVDPGRLDVLGSGPFWRAETASIHHLVADRLSLPPIVTEACEREGLRAVIRGTLSMPLDDWLETELHPALEEAEPGVAIIWLGELTLPLGPNPPSGGRCHEAAAKGSGRLGPNQSLIVFGTDGLDGTSRGAGAVTFGGMAPVPEHLIQTHRTLEWCLHNNASLPTFFTGSNLNDVAVLITQ